MPHPPSFVFDDSSFSDDNSPLSYPSTSAQLDTPPLASSPLQSILNPVKRILWLESKQQDTDSINVAATTENESQGSLADASLSMQEEEEDARLLAESESYEINGHTCVDDDETTMWLKYTKWPSKLAGKPLDIISASTQKPLPYSDDYLLGSWMGKDFLSPVADEAKLLELMTAVDCMFKRALETLDETHYRTRCWLVSYNEMKFRPIPFTRLQHGETKYITI